MPVSNTNNEGAALPPSSPLRSTSETPYHYGVFSWEAENAQGRRYRKSDNKCIKFAFYLKTKGIDVWSDLSRAISPHFVNRMNYFAIEYPEHYAVWRTMEKLEIDQTF